MNLIHQLKSKKNKNLLMALLPNILFGLLLTFGIGFFVRNIQKIRRNIRLGIEVSVAGSSKQRWINMTKIAPWPYNQMDRLNWNNE